MARTPLASLREPETDDGGWFDLSAPVGLRFASPRADAIRLEGLLANAGDLDLAERGGPTGYWGLARDFLAALAEQRKDRSLDGERSRFEYFRRR